MTASPKRLFAISLEEIGDRPKFSWQTGHGTHIAAAGSLNVITIRNRQGDEIASIPLKGPCLQMSWDKDGDTLAVITEKSNLVYLWSANSQKTNVIDTPAKDYTTVISWSKSSPILAIGTSRGNIILYDQPTAKKLPLIGQHSGRITTMAWSKDNLLAIGANDNRISVMSSNGTVLQRCDTTDTPKHLKFSEMKREKRGTYEESTVSAVIGKKHLGLWTVGDSNNNAASAAGSQLFTLNFQDKYGDISDYQWFGDGYIMIGFSGGYFIVISTYHKEIGEELHKTRDHKGYLSSIAISTALNRAATCGNGGIKIHELSDQYVIDSIITIDEGNDNLSDIEASKTAIIIAQQDQESGNYRSARDVLFTMHQELKAQHTAIPFEMANSLMLLHSYILVKIQIKLNNHNHAARLLNRVSHNVSKFPAHIVQILTTTVIECQKAGMNNSAFNFSLILMKPEYRDQIDAKYKKKIEALVRKPDKSESEEDFSQCPHCHQRVPTYELLCPSCQLALPYCIVTGAHILREDLCLCPSCNFPAIHSEFLRYLSIDDVCPMCTTKIDGSRITKLDSGAAVDSFLAQSSDMS
ncbi:unnamed protein product [Rotaria sordida]|uniref:WD repeat-containing protein 19 n=1 Tax=Rotaria sordida TaxID=392033 RepID=A0A813X8K4_9BILA|nr:unnamed protein product [Rotaria sordida]